MICPYCKKPAALTTGVEIYPHKENLADDKFYICRPCDARVGVHKGTEKPYGTMAQSELRSLRTHAHKHLDRLWKNGYMTREEAYIWLAFALQVPFKFCHIGSFDKHQCSLTIALSKKKLKGHRNKIIERKNNGK